MDREKHGAEARRILAAQYRRIAAIEDDVERMQAAHEWVKAVNEFEIQFSDLRHFASLKLTAQGRKVWPLARIAEVLGLTGASPRGDAQAIVRGRRALRAKRED